jgi:hypothetical protein
MKLNISKLLLKKSEELMKKNNSTKRYNNESLIVNKDDYKKRNDHILTKLLYKILYTKKITVGMFKNLYREYVLKRGLDEKIIKYQSTNKLNAITSSRPLTYAHFENILNIIGDYTVISMEIEIVDINGKIEKYKVEMYEDDIDEEKDN